MKILILRGDMLSAVPYHRQIVPHMNWNWEDDGIVIANTTSPNLIQMCEKFHFDLVLYSVFVIEPYVKWIDWMKHNGTKFVLDIDDLYPYKKVKGSLSIADAVITPSPNLDKEYFRHHKKSAYLIENGIDSADPQWKPVKREGELTFGYMGSTRHEKDLELIKSDIKILTAVDYTSVVNSECIGMMPVDKYGHLYDEIDVSLAPLVNNSFNKSKSSLKAIEAGFKKKALICSDILPYSKDGDIAKAAILTDDFDKEMKSMTKSKAEDMGEALFEAVQKYEIKTLNKKRREIYQEIIK